MVDDHELDILQLRIDKILSLCGESFTFNNCGTKILVSSINSTVLQVALQETSTSMLLEKANLRVSIDMKIIPALLIGVGLIGSMCELIN